MNKIAGAIAALAMALTLAVAAPADARDTGWDCRSCRVSTK